MTISTSKTDVRFLFFTKTFSVATKKAELVNLPDCINSPDQLAWFIKDKKGNSKSTRCKRSPSSSNSISDILHNPSSKDMFFPCRKCDPSEAIGLNIPETFDTNTKTLIQFIDPGMKMGCRQIVSNRKLIPYHNRSEQQGDVHTADKRSDHDSVALEWCLVLSQRYKSQIRRKHSLSETQACAQMKYLQRILQHAIENRTRLSQQQMDLQQEILSLEEEENRETLGCSTTEVISDDGLDEPYTQDWGDRNEYNGCHPVSITGPKEPLRPGDVITYRSHLFVAGDKRGERVATVVQVRPKEDPILRLDNNEVLLSTTQVKRIRVMKRGALEEHPQGLYREIREFKLLKAGPLPGYQKSIEARRLGKIVQKLQDQYIQTAEQQGMPVDLLNQYKKSDSKESLANKLEVSTASKEKGKREKQKKSNSATDKGRCRATRTSVESDNEIKVKRQKRISAELWNDNSTLISKTPRRLQKTNNIDETDALVVDSPLLRAKSRRKSMPVLVGSTSSITRSSSRLNVTRRK